MPDNNNVLLPVNISRLNAWSGHLPATRVRLQVILEKAAARSGGATLAERALYAVCVFWSAVAIQTLAWHLGANPEEKLQSMSALYRAMGAKKVASALTKTLAELNAARTDSQRQQCICALESLLLRARGSVDELIGRFALRVVSQPKVLERLACSPAQTSSFALAETASDLLPAIDIMRPPGYVRWRTETHASRSHDVSSS